MSSSCAGCTAMPVSSGPTFPPSPECIWHLPHCSLKTSLPRTASPPALTTGSISSITFCRSAFGRPPPAARIFFARSRMARSGWSVSFARSTIGRSPRLTVPFSRRSTSLAAQSRLASTVRTAASRTCGVSEVSLSSSAAGASTADDCASAAIKPAESSGLARPPMRERIASTTVGSAGRSVTSRSADSARLASGESARSISANKASLIRPIFESSALEPMCCTTVTS